MEDGTVFMGEKDEQGRILNKMSHNACAWPGVIALDDLIKGYNVTNVNTAKKLTETCIKGYMNTKT